MQPLATQTVVAVGHSTAPADMVRPRSMQLQDAPRSSL